MDLKNHTERLYSSVKYVAEVESDYCMRMRDNKCSENNEISAVERGRGCTR